MNFSKPQMQDELFKFLTVFGKEIESLLGTDNTEWIEPQDFKDSTIWKAVSEMYDYGIRGIPTGDLGPQSIINGPHARIEMFFRSIDTPPMKIYLDACNTSLPCLAMYAVQSAVARTVLDGGDRHTDYGVDVYGLGKGDGGYLTLAEVALLANMDERSVRNAANPKLADPLKTEQVGKRSLVSVEEARRWLVGRKGFVQTRESKTFVMHRPPEWNVEIPQDLIEQIHRKAEERGVSPNVLLKEMVLGAAEKVMKEGEEK
ncbi:hypothetical protein ABC383_17730 [Noviherbaspirillum sp. 1P10PC]|uniref:hypothetical protein n=1 Tax=Noviherbaspirillum sp. 1P10PC TaxID=3132292 RepID=UPI00399F3D0B